MSQFSVAHSCEPFAEPFAEPYCEMMTGAVGWCPSSSVKCLISVCTVAAFAEPTSGHRKACVHSCQDFVLDVYDR